MVQVIDNLTRIDGEILSARLTLGWATIGERLNVRIDAAAPVEGRADLLSSHVGETMGFSVRRDLLGSAAAGDFSTVAPSGSLTAPCANHIPTLAASRSKHLIRSRESASWPISDTRV